MTNFPEHWIISQLSDVATVNMGQSPDSRSYNHEGSGLPFFQGKAEFGNLYPTVRKWCTEPTKIAEAGDILLSVRAPVGPTNLASDQCCIGRGLAAIRAIEPLDQMYLLHYFRWIESWLTQQGTGTTFAAISGDIIKTLDVPVAPLNEQKRIADKLDTLLAQVDACRERLNRVPQILKRFRQAVLSAATTGALTEEWRKTNSLKRDWPRAHLAELGELGRGKSKHRPRNDSRLYGGTYPFIQTGEVAQSGGTIHSHTQTYSDFGLAQSKLWPVGTVCITIAANIANTAILSYPACFPDSVVGFVASPPRCLPQFVKWSIDVQRAELESFAPATAQKNINLAVLNDVEFELPSLVEQHEIVRHVETLFAFADHLETRYAAARTQVENMTPALLAKAFRGELVPQDPNDEPASELLERIKEQKMNQPEQKRKPRTNTIKNERHMKTKAVTTLNELVSVLDQLGGNAMVDRLVIESGLSDDIDRFFELLREGRNTLLDVPKGSNRLIRRIVDANQ